ncbi:EF hand family protein [Trichomonas vaginalis G3]|uniref:EF hand family protein n=1 Tax=Trichomonas vaginalis (strain ATCC PRA-98 / G3) TaxID=412133 RepID=A2EF99_TRIV3|nr:calcium ion binding [Trichomonas vaginalis G3]EAY08709.1 EF hand family protein [Trichomonas vaginalis G3]KAI5492836.1 calcium ion binding [Trichomonas vaginalis G3]|eukprot:XP_001320932.1 EF hand family protein [Trichomonas vaginalis G3]
MGNEQSLEVSSKEYQALVEQTHFNKEEVAKLYSTFKDISATHIDDGKIDFEEFFKMLGFTNRGFAQKVFDAFDTSPDKVIDFQEFVTGLSHVCNRATLEEKAKFVFNVYDADKSGQISKDELKDVMLQSLGENSSIKLPPQVLDKIINDTFKKMDLDGNGEISLDEFIASAKQNPSILNCVSVDVNKIFQ